MIFYSFAEYFVKLYAQSPRLSMVYVSLLFYTLNTLCCYPILAKYNSITITGMLWAMCNIIMCLFVGIIIFDEPLTYKQIFGIVLGIVAVILLSCK